MIMFLSYTRTFWKNARQFEYCPGTKTQENIKSVILNEKENYHE